MSSRRNDSAGVAIVELTALLPWWGGVMLAGASYGALHLYVSRPMSPVSPGDSTFLIQAMARALAITGQYLLPVLFLIAALTSVLRRRKRRQLLAGVSAWPESHAHRWPAASRHDPAGVSEFLGSEECRRPDRSGRISSVSNL